MGCLPSRRSPALLLAVPAVTLALAAAVAGSLAAYGSSSAAATSLTALYGTAMQRQCTAVADVLSDGPDPAADPVGYAQAQILPLRQLTITDHKLARVVTELASAYQAYATSTGAASTSAALQAARAEAAVNAICPGAASR